MTLSDFIREMPKVELHVHLEGATQPETLLYLAEKNGVTLPVSTVEQVREWYQFRDFDHFVDIYILISECIRSVEDIEYITREFLRGQAAQNIRYTEATYTANTHYKQKGISFEDQLAAINRARAWAAEELGVYLNLIIDISRETPLEQSIRTAEWVIAHHGDGVVALGLGGAEVGHPPEDHAPAFELALNAGVPCIPHAGETVGPESVWSALSVCDALRIGHGVRSIEDPALVDHLRERQIPLEVCPTSNVCLGVYPSLAEHPLPQLVEAGVYVTINSDDPPMFNTSLTQEFEAIAEAFGYGPDALQAFTLNALRAALIPPAQKSQLEREFHHTFAELRAQYGLANERAHKDNQ
jgi:adenosine deaminase